MSSIKTLTEYLTKEFSEYDLICGEAITYLEAIVGKLSEHFFICHKDFSKKSDLKFICGLKPTQTSEKGDDMNLTGSPLKDVCALDEFDLTLSNLKLNPWNYEEEAYIGINQHEARKIICNCDFQKFARACMVWILCDADDVDKTIFMSSELEPDYFGRGIITYRGTKPKTINAKEIMDIHFEVSNTQETEISLENIFHIDTNISVRVTWETTSENPQLDFCSEADVTLNQSVNVENSGSDIESFWNELHFLSEILGSIIEFQNSDLIEPIYGCGDGLEEEVLREKIKAIMDKLTEEPVLLDKKYDESAVEISSVIQTRINQNPDEITDRLWNVLKRCSCYTDLKGALEYIFELAIHYINVPSVNLPLNNNRLANLIREICNGRNEIPSLAGTEPVELLLEIGLEKLYRDYEYILAESNICSAQALKCLLKQTNYNTVDKTKATAKSKKSLFKSETNSPSANEKDEPQNNWEEMLMQLVRIHLSLEHMLLLQSNLQIQKVQHYLFQQLMNIKPKAVQELINDVYHSISIPLTTCKMLDQFVMLKPNTRKIVMSSKSLFRDVKHIFYYNTEYIFPPNAFKGISPTTDETLNFEKEYHSWKYLKIKSKRIGKVFIKEDKEPEKECNRITESI